MVARHCLLGGYLVLLPLPQDVTVGMRSVNCGCGIHLFCVAKKP